MGKIGRLTISEMYQLQIRADRVMRFVASKSLEPYHLTIMEWQAISVISGKSDEGITMTRIAKMLDVAPPQISALTEQLIKKRLINQKIIRTDRRNKYLSLTKRGVDVKKRTDKNIEEAVNNLLSAVQPGQFIEYQKTIQQIATGFNVN